ncbi:MAG TPA: hypothetical protein VKS44_07960 [Candidatus Acidoferrales bacterium]|nr:hypothetical protein [Candidatus Acidoferrales bacterium]
MLTVEQYAASVVGKYQVIPETGSAAHRAADAVMPVLKEWAGQSLLGITLSGAYAHNTAISLASSVDVLVSLSPIAGMEMKAVFWNLFEFLTKHDLKAGTRQVSMQVQSKGLKVDIIPVYRDPAGSGCLLHNRRSETAIRTDPARHVHLVANSGRSQEICAIKIWRERSSLEFPSLYLELSVMQALEGERFGQLSDNISTVFRYLSGRFRTVAVRDPANSDNVVSDDLADVDKQAVAKAAHAALYEENWKKIFW